MKSLRFIAAALILCGLTHAQEPRLSNISTRAQTGTGSAVLTAGFVIGPGASKQVLVRAIGPTLGTFGVTGAVADPVLTIFNSANATVATNDNWLTADAATFTAVGAFSLPAASKDAAIVTTLAPGSYTAQVAGAGGTTGNALVEVYEVGATGGKLINTSTRLNITTGASPIIGFVVSPGGGRRTLVLRAAGPALAGFGLAGTLSDPSLTLTTATGEIVATNDNWSTPASATAASATLLGTAFTTAGAFTFSAGSKDAALLVDLAPGNYGIQASGVGGAGGLALIEVYDVTASSPPTVTLAASKSTSDETGSNPGEFTVTRSGDTLSALTVQYGVGGTATNGLDYPPLLGTVTIPAGQSSAKISLAPYPDTAVETAETVTLTLASDAAYTVGSPGTATVSIADTASTLYVANLRPGATAGGSAASGLATIVLSANGTLATVNVSFSNLSSGQVGAHLFLGNSTSTGDYVLNLPLGQVSDTQWTIQATSTYTVAQIVDALRNGLIYVGLDSANFPAGELRGAFLSALGSQTFAAPPAPPAVNLTMTTTDAARLLMQATFGAKQSELDAMVGTSVDTWITAQMAIPASSHRAGVVAESVFFPALIDAATGKPAVLTLHRMAAWWDIALNGNDQLRQRVAFALSQILVISDAQLAGPQYGEGMGHYNDLLANHAFGSFRTLLEQVTLNPLMGTYLSSLRNAKADAATGTNPDENYAREVMQLFTIGLVQLQPDGTLKLDAQGLPIPTYNQATITETAKVFTGWGYYSKDANPNFRRVAPDYVNPMMMYEAFHESGAKTIVNATVLPANLGGVEDLKRTLDALVRHPNTAPFIARQLIQRLVTDNPSPAYVYRVAQKFGPDGDLGAMVRAILTDYEARSPAVYDDPGYGKLREPLLRLTNLLRSFGAPATNGHYYGSLQNPENALAQAALRAPSVFNFFEPGYVHPGPIAAAGLVAPEFQITNDTTAITVPNFLRQFTFAAAGSATANSVVLNLTAEQAIATNSSALLDRLSNLLCGGQLGAASRTRITTALAGLGTTTGTLERAQSAILLVATSPDGAIQK